MVVAPLSVWLDRHHEAGENAKPKAGHRGGKPGAKRIPGEHFMIDPLLGESTVLITGANHGIGAASARAFAGQGAKVFLAYYRVPAGLSGSRTGACQGIRCGGGRPVSGRATDVWRDHR